MTPDGKEGFYYIVRRGDSLSKIAGRYGVRGGWKEIWENEKNQEFRSSRESADLIYLGDRIWVPAASPKRVAAYSGKHVRVVKRLARVAKVGINYPWHNYGWDFGDPPGMVWIKPKLAQHGVLKLRATSRN